MRWVSGTVWALHLSSIFETTVEGANLLFLKVVLWPLCVLVKLTHRALIVSINKILNWKRKVKVIDLLCFPTSCGIWDLYLISICTGWSVGEKGKKGNLTQKIHKSPASMSWGKEVCTWVIQRRSWCWEHKWAQRAVWNVISQEQHGI